MKMKYILILSLAALASLKADLLIDVKPSNIIAGFTKTLSINCSFIRTDISTMVKLTSLVILRSNGTYNLPFYSIASVDLSDGLKNITGDVSGLIDNRHESYLALTWNNPKSTLAGTYICEANGQNLHGQTVTIPKDAEVKVTSLKIEDLLEVLEIQSSELGKLQENFEKISSSYNEKCICCERFNKSLQSVYHISDLHNGSRYYLSPVSSILLMKEAEGQCELMGGYLTEVDSEDEYLFIKNFLMNYTGYDVVYTGGNDEAMEKNWVNTYSKTPVKYIKWGQGEPNSGRESNCLGLWKDSDWAAGDTICFQGPLSSLRGYLCEVPE